MSGQVVAWKGNGDREKDKGSLHTRGRSGTPASPVVPIPQVCRTSGGEAPRDTAMGVGTSRTVPAAAERERARGE